MVEMKSGEVVLSLAAQLASWRAVLVLVRIWATCKPWQRTDFQYSIFLADCLNQSKQTVWESAGGGAVATESRKVGKVRRKRRYADVFEPGATPEPELGPRGPTLKKQALKGLDGLDLQLHLGLQPGDKDSSPEESSSPFSAPEDSFLPEYFRPLSADSEAMDPAGSPSSIRKVADPARPSASSSPSAAPVPAWRSLFCLGNRN